MFGFLLRALTGFLLTALIVSSWFIAAQMHNLNIFLGTLLGALVIWFGLQGYLLGAAAALFGWGKFFAAVFAGYFFGTAAGTAVGMGGIAASIGGFYLCAIAVYVVIGLFGKLLIDPNRTPGFFDRSLGLCLGAAEGIIMFALAAWPLSLYQPAWNQAPASLPTQLSKAVSERVIDPLVPAQASGVVVLFELARDARGGIDPEKVDRQRLSTIFEPVKSHPKIQALSNDAEVCALVQQKNAAGLMKHPKVIALLNDPEIQSLAAGIDLHEVASLLRPGVKRPGE